VVEVALRAVRVDLQSRTPVLVLQDIGEPEAVAIECAVRGVPAPRPLTHDLLRDVLDALGARLERIVVTELRESTYFAELHLVTEHGPKIISARPSDAVALALRAGSPLFVDDELMEDEGRLIELAEDDEDEDEDEDEDSQNNVEELAEQFRDFLDSVHPEDFQQ